MGYYSAIKKNEVMPLAATWMDLEISILSEVSQTKTNIWYRLYAESKKMIQMNLFTKQKQTQRMNWWLLGGGIDWEFGIDMYTLLYLK